MAAKRKKKGFILQQIVGSDLNGELLTSALTAVAGAVSLFIGLGVKKTEEWFSTPILTFAVMVGIAVLCAFKAWIVYYPIYRETKSIRPAEFEEKDIDITRIKKTHRLVYKSFVVSAYTVYFRTEAEKGKYYFIPLARDEVSIEKLKKRRARVTVYRGTRVIKAYSEGKTGENEASRRLIRQAAEAADGLWTDIIETLESGRLETVWPSGTSVEYCSMNKTGDMIDITLERDGGTVCFNMDKDSIYICYPDSDREETQALSGFDGIEALLSYMQKCAEL